MAQQLTALYGTPPVRCRDGAKRLAIHIKRITTPAGFRTSKVKSSLLLLTALLETCYDG